eukprot:15337739-Ditylum_brightwellii.AAC.1
MEEDVVIPLSSLSLRMEEDVVIPSSSLKLALQKIVEFSGRIKDWQKWKIRTSCAHVGLGYDAVLKKKITADNNSQLNQVVYLQFAVATSS